MAKIEIPDGVLVWLERGEHGLSSKFMVKYLFGFDFWGRRHISGNHHPLDPADLRRCALLLESDPEVAVRFPEMATASTVWASLVADWDTLIELMDSEAPDWREGRRGDHCDRTFERMRGLGT